MTTDVIGNEVRRKYLDQKLDRASEMDDHRNQYLGPDNSTRQKIMAGAQFILSRAPSMIWDY